MKTEKSGAGIVNEFGEVYMTGVPEKGQLKINWNTHGKCTADYELSDKRYFKHLYCSCNLFVKLNVMMRKIIFSLYLIISSVSAVNARGIDLESIMVSEGK